MVNIELHQKGGPGSLTLNYDVNVGFSYSVDLPPNDQVLALMHRLGPFVLKNEPTYFYKICNILGKQIKDEDFRKYLESVKNLFSGQNFRNIAVLRSNDIIINSEDTLKIWLNAYEYHRDPDKRVELEMLHKIVPIEASRAIFIMMLYDMSRAIFIISNMIKIFIGKINKFSHNTYI